MREAKFRLMQETGRRVAITRVMASYQIAPPERFDISKPDEWPKWLRRFERFRQASGLIDKDEESQVNTLIYTMGDEVDDILHSLALSADDKKKYGPVKAK